ncbi:hypothetical protein AMK32_16985 [Streptomyces sp. CB01883]|nr:hypothetical protein AMK32_16985 [Streptomyces sp. CB01883]
MFMSLQGVGRNFRVPYYGRCRRGVALRRTVDILLSEPEPAPGGGPRAGRQRDLRQAVHAPAPGTGAECAAVPRCVRVMYRTLGGAAPTD